MLRQIKSLLIQSPVRPPWTVEVQKLHDCMDAGGRVMQEQLPRRKFLSTQSRHLYSNEFLMRKFNILYVLSFFVIIYGAKIIFTGEIRKGIVMNEENLIVPYGMVILLIGFVIFYFAYKK